MENERTFDTSILTSFSEIKYLTKYELEHLDLTSILTSFSEIILTIGMATIGQMEVCFHTN